MTFWPRSNGISYVSYEESFSQKMSKKDFVEVKQRVNKLVYEKKKKKKDDIAQLYGKRDPYMGNPHQIEILSNFRDLVPVKGPNGMTTYVRVLPKDGTHKLTYPNKQNGKKEVKEEESDFVRRMNLRQRVRHTNTELKYQKEVHLRTDRGGLTLDATTRVTDNTRCRSKARPKSFKATFCPIFASFLAFTPWMERETGWSSTKNAPKSRGSTRGR